MGLTRAHNRLKMLDWCRACACINNHIKAPRASTQVGRGLRKIAATLAKAGVLAEGSEPLAHRVARAEQMAAARRGVTPRTMCTPCCSRRRY